MKVNDSWEQVWDNNEYIVYLIPEDEVLSGEAFQQYPLNYGIVYKETMRVEGMTPTFIGAKLTAIQLEEQMNQQTLLEDIEKTAVDKVVEMPEVH